MVTCCVCQNLILLPVEFPVGKTQGDNTPCKSWLSKTAETQSPSHKGEFCASLQQIYKILHAVTACQASSHSCCCSSLDRSASYKRGTALIQGRTSETNMLAPFLSFDGRAFRAAQMGDTLVIHANNSSAPPSCEVHRLTNTKGCQEECEECMVKNIFSYSSARETEPDRQTGHCPGAYSSNDTRCQSREPTAPSWSPVGMKGACHWNHHCCLPGLPSRTLKSRARARNLTLVLP